MLFGIWCWNIFTLLSFWYVGEVAEYDYTFSENEVFMEFRIDRHELDHLKIEVNNCNYTDMQALCFSQYIEGKQTLKIDGHTITLSLDKVYTKEGHYILLLKGETLHTDWRKLELINQCFLRTSEWI